VIVRNHTVGFLAVERVTGGRGREPGRDLQEAQGHELLESSRGEKETQGVSSRRGGSLGEDWQKEVCKGGGGEGCSKKCGFMSARTPEGKLAGRGGKPVGKLTRDGRL